jgi:hypothetical protein
MYTNGRSVWLRHHGVTLRPRGGGLTDLDTTAGIPPLGYQPQPATLPPVPTNERLSFAVDQFPGSGHPGGVAGNRTRYENRADLLKRSI